MWKRKWIAALDNKSNLEQYSTVCLNCIVICPGFVVCLEFLFLGS